MQGMNITEQKAYDWLVKQGYTGISFSGRRTPDFVTVQGSFEVKRSRNSTISFGATQIEQLSVLPATVLVFDDNAEPIAAIPSADMQSKPNVWQNIRITYHKADLPSGYMQRRATVNTVSVAAPVGEGYLTPRAVAEQLHVGLKRVYHWLRVGRLAGIFSHGNWFISELAVHEFETGMIRTARVEPIVSRDYYTPTELKERYGLNLETIYRWLKSGRLRGIKLGPRIWRIPESAIRDFEAARGGKQ